MKLIVALSTDTIEELKKVINKIEEIDKVAWVSEQAEDDGERDMINKEVSE